MKEKARQFVAFLPFGLGAATGREVFCKKGVLRNFAKLTGKHLCQSLIFNKVAGLRSEFQSFQRVNQEC